VFPVSPALAAYFLTIEIIVAVTTGVVTGILASLCLRLPMRGIWKDALLGLLGFLLFFAVDIFSPFGSFLINRGVDPVLVSLTGAALFPLLRELLRFRRSRSSSPRDAEPLTGK
jgi:hypothetical protein